VAKPAVELQVNGPAATVSAGVVVTCVVVVEVRGAAVVVVVVTRTVLNGPLPHTQGVLV
jgi:hypothetical protein